MFDLALRHGAASQTLRTPPIMMSSASYQYDHDFSGTLMKKASIAFQRLFGYQEDRYATTTKGVERIFIQEASRSNTHVFPPCPYIRPNGNKLTPRMEARVESRASDLLKPACRALYKPESDVVRNKGDVHSIACAQRLSDDLTLQGSEDSTVDPAANPIILSEETFLGAQADAFDSSSFDASFLLSPIDNDTIPLARAIETEVSYPDSPTIPPSLEDSWSPKKKSIASDKMPHLNLTIEHHDVEELEDDGWRTETAVAAGRDKQALWYEFDDEDLEESESVLGIWAKESNFGAAYLLELVPSHRHILDEQGSPRHIRQRLLATCSLSSWDRLDLNDHVRILRSDVTLLVYDRNTTTVGHQKSGIIKVVLCDENLASQRCRGVVLEAFRRNTEDKETSFEIDTPGLDGLDHMAATIQNIILKPSMSVLPKTEMWPSVQLGQDTVAYRPQPSFPNQSISCSPTSIESTQGSTSSTHVDPELVTQELEETSSCHNIPEYHRSRRSSMEFNLEVDVALQDRVDTMAGFYDLTGVSSNPQSQKPRQKAAYQSDRATVGRHSLDAGLRRWYGEAWAGSFTGS